MIFRDAPPGPALRPGMGYAPGARGMGLSHAPQMRGYKGGAFRMLGALGQDYGSISDSIAEAGLESGQATEADLELLGSVGATDQDIENLINGNITLAQLYANYGITIPGTAVPASASVANLPLSTPSTVGPSLTTVAAPGSLPTTPAATPTATPAAASTAQSPSGSTLVYSVSWTAGISNLTVSANSAIASLTAALHTYGMSVVSSNATQTGPINFQIQFTILDTIGHALLTDAQSVLNSLMQSIVGNNLSGSSISLVSSPGQSTASASAAASSLTTWLENNALFLGVGVAALIVLSNMTGGKRR